jgi:hypothetical protein
VCPSGAGVVSNRKCDVDAGVSYCIGGNAGSGPSMANAGPSGAGVVSNRKCDVDAGVSYGIGGDAGSGPSMANAGVGAGSLYFGPLRSPFLRLDNTALNRKASLTPCDICRSAICLKNLVISSCLIVRGSFRTRLLG